VEEKSMARRLGSIVTGKRGRVRGTLLVALGVVLIAASGCGSPSGGSGATGAAGNGVGSQGCISVTNLGKLCGEDAVQWCRENPEQQPDLMGNCDDILGRRQKPPAEDQTTQVPAGPTGQSAAGPTGQIASGHTGAAPPSQSAPAPSRPSDQTAEMPPDQIAQGPSGHTGQAASNQTGEVPSDQGAQAPSDQGGHSTSGHSGQGGCAC
jgi:hypothetical protein